jgi:hypothetical protein
MEKMKGMGLKSLSQMQEPSKFFRCGGQAVDADQLVNGLGCRQMMADRANAAEPLDQNGDFPVGAALDETLESPKFDNVESGLLYPVILIQEERHFAVTLHPGDRINDHAAKPLGLGGCFWNGRHGRNPGRKGENPRLPYRKNGVALKQEA